MVPCNSDIVIIGDYNMIPVRDRENFVNMNPDGYLTFPTLAELSPRDGYGKVFSHISSSGGGVPGNLLDGMAISQVHTTEYVSGSIEVVPVEFYFGGILSGSKSGSQITYLFWQHLGSKSTTTRG